MSEPAKESKKSIIDTVKTPLGFLVLGFLIVDGTVASLALALKEFQAPLVWTVIVSIPLFVATVVGVALYRPEALQGVRPFQELYANQFAGDLFIAMDGPLRNLEALEREEAWLIVSDVIRSGTHADANYTKFCARVAERLNELTNLANKSFRPRGPKG